MKVFIERMKENKELSFAGDVKELLSHLGVIADEVLVIKNGELVTSDEQVEDTDSIELLSVISGG